jgi:hypothetical protein
MGRTSLRDSDRFAFLLVQTVRDMDGIHFFVQSRNLRLHGRTGFHGSQFAIRGQDSTVTIITTALRPWHAGGSDLALLFLWNHAEKGRFQHSTRARNALLLCSLDNWGCVDRAV